MFCKYLRCACFQSFGGGGLKCKRHVLTLPVAALARHTYSTTHRGVEVLLSTYALLDMTPLGRQECGNGMNGSGSNGFKLHDQY